MLFSKVKNVVALGMIVLALTAGVGAWRYAAVAGQTEKRPQERPIRADPMLGAAAPPKAPPHPIAPANRTFQIDLKIVERKDGQRKVLAAPLFHVMENKPSSFSAGDYRTIHLGGGITEEVVMGPTIRVVIRWDQGSKVRLDLTVRRPRQEMMSLSVSQPQAVPREDFVLVETQTFRLVRSMPLAVPVTFKMDYKASPALEVNITVHEVKEDPRTGRPSQAPKALATREKPPARVGQIFITGNKKIPDKAILEQVPLFPGGILSYPDLRIYEKNLARLKGLKSNPTVTVIDREGDGVFKDIQITVEEK